MPASRIWPILRSLFRKEAGMNKNSTRDEACQLAPPVLWPRVSHARPSPWSRSRCQNQVRAEDDSAPALMAPEAVDPTLQPLPQSARQNCGSPDVYQPPDPAKEVWGNHLFTSRDYREVPSRPTSMPSSSPLPTTGIRRYRRTLLKAGKDVYREKPMVQLISDGPKSSRRRSRRAGYFGW